MEKKQKKPSGKKVLDLCPNIDDCPDKNCETCNNIPLRYFVKHPPNGTFTIEELEKMSLFIGELEIKPITDNKDGIKLPVSFYIVSGEKKFKETKNPVYAIEAFINAHQAGLYPPLSILNFLADTFKKYHEMLGDVSLDKLLGFSGWKGQYPAFKQVIMNEDRDQPLMLDIYRLRRLFNISVEKSAAMVSARLNEMPDKEWNKTGLKINKPGYHHLRDRYFDKWIKIFEQDDHDEITGRGFAKWTEDDKIEYLKKYPSTSIPPKLKQKYKLR